MSKGRLEAFSDGVIAIIITIMVLDLKPPAGTDLASLVPLVPTFLSYVLSFVHVGIYWNNHHHLFQAARHVNGLALWANLHLLFWLSLVPFATHWLGASDFATGPVIAYGAVLLLSGVAYFLLTRALVALHGSESALATAVADDSKGKLSVVLYALALPAALVHPWVSCGVYCLVAAIWLVPDPRMESAVSKPHP